MFVPIEVAGVGVAAALERAGVSVGVGVGGDKASVAFFTYSAAAFFGST
jgi:hypothetical protein